MRLILNFFNNEIEGASKEMSQEVDIIKSLKNLHYTIELVILIRNLSFTEQLNCSP
jgi:hypothetical protein